MTLDNDSLESAVKTEFRKRILPYGALIKGTWLESRTRRSGGALCGHRAERRQGSRVADCPIPHRLQVVPCQPHL